MKALIRPLNTYSKVVQLKKPTSEVILIDYKSDKKKFYDIGRN